MKKVFLVIILLFSVINVKAYENDYFSIEIPEGYEEIIKDNNYFWKNGNKYISIIVSDNVNNHNISKYTEEDLEEEKKHLKETYKKELEEYNINIKVSKMEKVKINDNYALKYELYWPTLDITGYDMYQKGLVYTTEKYIVTLVYNNDEKIKKDETYENILNTFVIKDKHLKNDTKIYVISIISIGIILGIVKYFINRKKS